jgi:sugar phosphate isomerase/epimerase
MPDLPAGALRQLTNPGDGRKRHFGTPFRIGSTSYVFPADILPNVEQLAAAGATDDIELILFEVDDGPNNLPAEAIIMQIDALARQAGISFTVHLPLDLTLAADGSAGHQSLEKARRVIARTLPLAPFAFVFHLDGQGVDQPGWADRALGALDAILPLVPDPALMAVENLESYPPTYLDGVLARSPISRTTDIGHFWKMGIDPMAYLPAWLPRTRVIHIHGMAERDHHSLALVPPADLDPVVAHLLDHYQGVVTLEVFETSDFFSSRAALLESANRANRRAARP